MAEEKKIPIPTTVEEMHALLKVLPEETERDYELTLVDYATEWPKEMVRENLKAMCNIVNPTVEEEKIAFALFAIAATRERRMKNRPEWDALLTQYAARFEEHPFCGHIQLLRMLNKGRELTEEDKAEMLKLARKNQASLVGNGGAQHALAEAIILIYELNEVTPKPELEATKNANLETAEKALNRALRSQSTYAKYYYTYARLQSLQGLFEKAMANVEEAIDLEKETEKDYAIRIGNYQSLGQKVHGKWQMEEYNRQADRKSAEHRGLIEEKLAEYNTHLEEKTREYRTALEEQEKQTMVKNMEFLGLFSGIVSFTIGSLTISGAIAEQSIAAAAGLIIILMGALLGVFAGFGIILHGTGVKKKVKVLDKKTGEMVEKEKRDCRNLAVLILGVLIAIGGLVLCLHIPQPSVSPETAAVLTKTVLELV